MTHDGTRRVRTTMTAVLLAVLMLAGAGLGSPAQALVCGDGFLDVLEDCDEGVANGQPDSCCTGSCTFVVVDTPCRDAAGACDVVDVCSGASGTCGADVKSTAECRPSAGVCDVAETCDGVGDDCPADGKSTAECRASAGVCDVAESCDGVGDDCPADAFEPASVECRASAGVCDVAETCTGSGAACPADGKSTAECRASAGVCDLAETCDGVSDACPADAKSTAVCRASAGSCDVVESCDGVADACPADAFEAASVECRPGAGVCDVAESCTGSSAACPSDGFATGVECRASAGECDVAEQCDGSGAACPADGFQPDETSCDDANPCSINDRCIGGVCGGFLENCGNNVIDGGCSETCDDGNFVNGDGCDENCHLEACGPEPLPGCRAVTVEGKAAVQVVNRPLPEKNRLQWKYTPGATTPKADFGNPTTTTSYTFCMWEEIAGDPRLAASYEIPAGGTCGTRPCWSESSKGFKYVDKEQTPHGISGLTLKEGLAAGKTKILLQGKGANLPMPVLPFIQNPNVVMQLKNSDGTCWETRYGMPAFRNQPDLFKDK